MNIKYFSNEQGSNCTITFELSQWPHWKDWHLLEEFKKAPVGTVEKLSAHKKIEAWHYFLGLKFRYNHSMEGWLTLNQRATEHVAEPQQKATTCSLGCKTLENPFTKWHSQFSISFTVPSELWNPPQKKSILKHTSITVKGYWYINHTVYNLGHEVP